MSAIICGPGLSDKEKAERVQAVQDRPLETMPDLLDDLAEIASIAQSRLDDMTPKQKLRLVETTLDGTRHWVIETRKAAEVLADLRFCQATGDVFDPYEHWDCSFDEVGKRAEDYLTQMSEVLGADTVEDIWDEENQKRWAHVFSDADGDISYRDEYAQRFYGVKP
jgi:hypothetical protein